MKPTNSKSVLPAKGNPLTRSLGRSVLWILGWKVKGTMPELSKLILIVAPHTSNWDFVLGIAAKLSLQLEVSWLGKKSLFVWPMSVLLRRLGGIPVDRSSPQGTVDQVVSLFGSREKVLLGMSPEGSRKKVVKWKTGFYHMALGADVPVLLVSMDYANKVIGIGPTLKPSGNLQADLEIIRSYYAGIKGKHPDLFSLPVVENKI
jgi:1-acyl-sn-glycerol-3-phosphate acyltransferase